MVLWVAQCDNQKVNGYISLGICLKALHTRTDFNPKKEAVLMHGSMMGPIVKTEQGFLGVTRHTFYI